MNNKLEFFEEFTLTPGAFDRYFQITPYAIFDIFQEVAARHATVLNAAFDKTNNNRIWLLLRNKYEVISPIEKPIKLKVKTWPLELKRIDYDRDYEIYDLNNNLLIKGTSKWCVYNLDTAMISRQLIKFPGTYSTNRVFSKPLKKIELINLKELNHVMDLKITPSYIDINDHVNNAKYSFILIDALNLSRDEIIKTVEFNFIKELKVNDLVSIYIRKIDNYYYCYGIIKDIIHFSSKVEIKSS